MRQFVLPAASAATATTAIAAAATTAITTASAAATTTARATFTGARFVDADRAAFEFGLVEVFDCPGGLVGISHFDEAESARLAGELIDDDYGAVDLPCLREKRFQVLIGHRVGEIAYVQFCGNLLAPSLVYAGKRATRETQAGLSEKCVRAVTIHSIPLFLRASKVYGYS